MIDIEIYYLFIGSKYWPLFEGREVAEIKY